jgi:hypothetical protein
MNSKIGKLKYSTWIACLGLFSSCGSHRDILSSPTTNSIGELRPIHSTNQPGIDYDKALSAALARADQLREEALRNSTTNELPLPNFSSGPGVPRPIGINFYEIDRHFPNYLLCSYDVYESHYDSTNEPEWFKAALLQIRGANKQSFPPIQWIAIAIVNIAEYKGASTFQQCFKAGAIFKADDVFSREHDLQHSIAQAEVDHHPFKYDPQGQPNQRWMIVERHASANHNTNGIPQK